MSEPKFTGERSGEQQDEVNWNEASFTEFQERQKLLREGARATTPYVSAGNYPQAEGIRGQLVSSGFEANLSHALGGVSVFVESEEGFRRLQEVAGEKGLKLEMTKPF